MIVQTMAKDKVNAPHRSRRVLTRPLPNSKTSKYQPVRFCRRQLWAIVVWLSEPFFQRYAHGLADRVHTVKARVLYSSSTELADVVATNDSPRGALKGCPAPPRSIVTAIYLQDLLEPFVPVWHDPVLNGFFMPCANRGVARDVRAGARDVAVPRIRIWPEPLTASAPLVVRDFAYTPRVSLRTIPSPRSAMNALHGKQLCILADTLCVAHSSQLNLTLAVACSASPQPVPEHVELLTS